MTSDPSPIGTDHQIAMRDRHIARLTDQLRLARDYIAGHRPYATRAEVLAEINEALTEDPTPKLGAPVPTNIRVAWASLRRA